uniref:Spermatosis associated serine rich 2 n=1 Tax=Pan paniscus TaxID=9597 RepID=A0A2R8ZQB5_PANPA
MSRKQNQKGRRARVNKEGTGGHECWNRLAASVPAGVNSVWAPWQHPGCGVPVTPEAPEGMLQCSFSSAICGRLKC